MTSKPELILDIGGVLATNFSPFFWQNLSSKSTAPYGELVKYKENIREELWTGRITEIQFWTWLREQFPSIEIKNAKLSLHANIKPLPAIEKVPTWSQYANIHLFTNHRIEWLESIINPIQAYTKSITISSQVGCCKPQTDIYVKVNSNLTNEENVLFIDDQERNFQAAKILGWDTLHADEKGKWVHKVEQLIKEGL